MGGNRIPKKKNKTSVKRQKMEKQVEGKTIKGDQKVGVNKLLKKGKIHEKKTCAAGLKGISPVGEWGEKNKQPGPGKEKGRGEKEKKGEINQFEGMQCPWMDQGFQKLPNQRLNLTGWGKKKVLVGGLGEKKIV